MTATRRVRALASLVAVTLLGAASARAGSIGFFANGENDIDRVKIRIDDPANNNNWPADVGAGDFTIEFWIKGNAADNNNPVRCGSGVYGWIDGDIVIDRDRFDLPRAWGLALGTGATGGGSRIAFGANVDNVNITTHCGSRNVLDGQWHHVAVTRSASGTIRLFVDGVADGSSGGVAGDLSYPDNGQPENQGNCGGQPCFNSDPFLVLGAEKHDARPRQLAFRGFIDELHLSTNLRYTAAFTPTATPFTPDANTAALYHFDEGAAGNCTTGTVITDSATGGASPGECRFGGSPGGPVFSADSPFAATPGSLQFSAANYNASEGIGSPTVSLSVTRNGGTGAVSVSYASADVTAVAGSDYTAVSNVLNWAAGDTAAKSFTVPIADDALVETAESFTVSLSGPTGGATLGSPATATVTIADNDSPGTLQLTAAALPTSETAGVRVVTVTRANGSAGAVTVNYATSDGPLVGGAVAPGDYTATNGTLSWASGDAASKSFNVAIVDDSVVDPAETFSVALSGPSGGATLGSPAAATITIADNDSPGLLAFETTGFTVAEAAGSATITVTRTNGTIGAISVNYASSNGVAMAPADYGAVAGTLSWANGDGAPKTFTVSVVNDTAVEGNEPLNLALSGATGNATISPPGAATLTIVDDDLAQPGTLQFTQATANAGEGSGTLVLTVSRTNGSDGTAQVTVVSTNGTATAGNDFQLLSQTLGWAAGENVSKTVTLTLINDANDEPGETLTVGLTGVTGATLGTPNAVTVTIDDDDPPLNTGSNGGGGGAADFCFLLLGGLARFLRRQRGPGLLRSPGLVRAPL